MIRRTLLSFVILSAALCSIAPAQQNAPATAIPTPATGNESADLVVARVSGQPITEKQVVDVIDEIAGQKQMPLDQLQQRNSLLFKDAVDNLIMAAILKNEARQRNLTIDKSVVDKQLQNFSQQFKSREDFEKAMANQGLTEEALRKNIESSLSIQEVINQAIKDLPSATEEDIRKFYDDNPDKFPMPERVHVAQILLKADPQSTPEQKAEVKKKLEGIRSEIESKTITFADAAAKYSQDSSSAQKGGDMGFVPRGKMVKSFEDAAFSAQVGGLSPIVESQAGYHLLQVLELRPAGKASFEEAKPAIKRYLDQRIKVNATQKYVDELKAKASIETFMTQEEFAKRHPAQ
jgi:peptidyl-prolyl cis-trans isomerase C